MTAPPPLVQGTRGRRRHPVAAFETVIYKPGPAMGGLGEALRDIGRRPVRSGLTAAGIAIGVAALVLLGALAEKMTRLVEGGRDFATGQITVSGAGAGAATGMTRGGLLSGEQLTALAAVPGVARTAPIVMFPVSDTPASMPFTLAPMVFGVDVEALLLNRRSAPPQVHSGQLVPGAGEVVIGQQVARFFHVDTGDALTVRGQQFRIAGVLESTLTGPDSFVFMDFPAAERLLIDTEPFLRRVLKIPGTHVLPVATAAAAFWADGEDPEAVAARIRERLENISVVSPHDAAGQIDRALAFLNGMIVGSALVALLVASLAVTNTMLTAVIERRREIGLRRVVGATRRQVIGQLVLEATVLGLGGSSLGLLAGGGAAHGLNALTIRAGAEVFLVTPRLALGALAFPGALAALAGLWPAWRATRVTPAQAMRYV